MIEGRNRRIYWVQKPDENDLLIFDPGYPNGEVYIYEKKESKQAKDIKEEIIECSKDDGDIPHISWIENDFVRVWAEKMGSSLMYWDLAK